jgi:hypothetical protein
VTVAREEEKLKLGKGASFFVKSRCRTGQRVVGGVVLSHAPDNVLAQRTVEGPPTVNDLANLLAEAMRLTR